MTPGQDTVGPTIVRGSPNTPTSLPTNLKNKRLITKRCESAKLPEACRKQRRVILKSFRLSVVATGINITQRKQQWRRRNGKLLAHQCVCVKPNTVINPTGARDKRRGWTYQESKMPICVNHTGKQHFEDCSIDFVFSRPGRKLIFLPNLWRLNR